MQPKNIVVEVTQNQLWLACGNCGSFVMRTTDGCPICCSCFDDAVLGESAVKWLSTFIDDEGIEALKVTLHSKFNQVHTEVV